MITLAILPTVFDPVVDNIYRTSLSSFFPLHKSVLPPEGANRVDDSGSFALN